MHKCKAPNCKMLISKHLREMAILNIQNGTKNKMNVIWIEASSCSGNIISLLNGENPDIIYLLENIINLKYNNSIMLQQGNEAFETFLSTLDTEFTLIIDGAISLKDEGYYNTIASFNNKLITGKEAITLASGKAKFIIALGTCASFGGISAGNPNPSECVSAEKFINLPIIKLPGCPCNPDWLIGTLAHLVLFGIPPLDELNRPLAFYGSTIHDLCPRRSYFDKGIFAKNIGDKECMFKLGCKGPITLSDCPIRKWNSRESWPVEDNTPCIGCVNPGFPDKMEPFIKRSENP